MRSNRKLKVLWWRIAFLVKNWSHITFAMYDTHQPCLTCHKFSSQSTKAPYEEVMQIKTFYELISGIVHTHTQRETETQTHDDDNVMMIRGELKTHFWHCRECVVVVVSFLLLLKTSSTSHPRFSRFTLPSAFKRWVVRLWKRLKRFYLMCMEDVTKKKLCFICRRNFHE